MGAARVIGALLVLGAASAPGARIEEFAPARGALLPGGTAESAVRVRNTGAARARLWVGYSVQDPLGRWHDVPARPVELDAGAASRLASGWTVPRAAQPGPYRVVMAVWSATPSAPGAVRLASAERAGAFRVFRRHDGPGALRPPRWTAGAHALGRGRVRRANVLPRPDGVHLRLPAGGCDGAELRGARTGFGSYTARLRVADAPGSLTAFFLYEDVPGDNDEIDVEIPGDGSRRVLLSTWVAGRHTNHAELRLPFDPRAGFHDYTIDYLPGSVAFLADGVELRRWTTALPRNPMRPMANAWWPVWLPCTAPASPRAAVIQWIRH